MNAAGRLRCVVVDGNVTGEETVRLPHCYTVPEGSSLLLSLALVTMRRTVHADQVKQTFVNVRFQGVDGIVVEGTLSDVETHVVRTIPLQLWLPAGTAVEVVARDLSVGGRVEFHVRLLGTEVP